MLNVAAVGVLALTMLFAPASIETAAATTAPPGKVTIDVQTVNGSGCPLGTASVAPSADNTSFVVAYDQFLAQDGGNAKPTDSRKNCQINVRVHVPDGYTYAIAQAEYNGFAGLAEGATATQVAHYYFTGMSATAEATHPFNGPKYGMWRTTDRADALVYAPCANDSLFNINTELRVDSGTSAANKTSVMTMDSTRGSVRTIYNLTWKQCG